MSGVGQKYLRGEIWYISYYVRDPITGRRRRRWECTNSTSEKYAAQLLRQRISPDNRITREAERITFQDLVDDLLNDYRANNRRSLGGVKARAEKHLITFFRRRRAIDIDTAFVRSYVSGRLESGAANATINRELAALRRMFNLAAERLGKSGPRIALLEENNVRQGFLGYGDFLKLRDALPQYLKGVFVFLYFSGWRLNSALSLERRDVDLEARVIRLRPEISKNRESATFPLSGEIYEVVQEAMQAARLDCPYLFHRNGKQIRYPYIAWRKACAEVGLRGLVFHDLCRSAIRNLDRAGVSDKVKMVWSGRKTRSIIDRYNIVHEDDLRDAGEKLGVFLDQRREAKIVKLKTE